MQSKSKSSMVVASPKVQTFSPSLSHVKGLALNHIQINNQSNKSITDIEQNVLVEESIADIKQFGD